MLGRKTSTPPTPSITPSVSISRNTGSVASGHKDFTDPLSQEKNSSM